MAEVSSPQYVPALRKGLALLELLADHGSMSLAQVERESGLNRTMAYRLLRVLGELGYVSMTRSATSSGLAPGCWAWVRQRPSA